MNKEWNKFLESVPWFLRKSDIVEVCPVRPPGSWKPAGEEFQKLFAPMHSLLSKARVTPVRINGRETHFVFLEAGRQTTKLAFSATCQP